MQAQDAHEQQHVDAPAPAVDSDAHEASASSGGSTLIGEHSVQAESGETHAEQEQDVVLEQEQSVIVMTGQQAAHHRVALACLLEDAGFAILRQSPPEQAGSVVLALERVNAVQELAQLAESRLGATLPDVTFYCSPDPAAAQAQMATLFREQGGDNVGPVDPASSEPFLRSPLPIDPSALERVLSPDIDNALRKASMFGGDVELPPLMSPSLLPLALQDMHDGARVDTPDNVATESVTSTTNLAHEKDAQELAKTSPRKSVVASTRAPAIKPRMSRAAALRLGLEVPSARVGSPSSNGGTKSPSTHPPLSPVKRVLSPADMPKSLAPPSVAPRQSRASALRAGKGAVDPIVTASPVASAPRQSYSTAERAAAAALDRERATATPSRGDSSSATARRDSTIAAVAKPKFEVRLSKAAALRAGVPFSPPVREAKKQLESQDGARTEARRRESAPVVRSTRPPAIAPRATKASSARTGVPAASEEPKRHAAPAPKRAVRMSDAAALRGATASPRLGSSLSSPLSPTVASTTASSATPSEDKSSSRLAPARRASLQVASTAKPKVEPRLTKAAMLRQGKDVVGAAAAAAAAAAATARRQSIAATPSSATSSFRRESSVSGASGARARLSVAPRMNRSSQLRAGGAETSPAALKGRSSSSASALLGPARPPRSAARPSSAAPAVAAATSLATSAAKTLAATRPAGPSALEKGDEPRTERKKEDEDEAKSRAAAEPASATNGQVLESQSKQQQQSPTRAQPSAAIPIASLASTDAGTPTTTRSAASVAGAASSAGKTVAALPSPPPPPLRGALQPISNGQQQQQQ